MNNLRRLTRQCCEAVDCFYVLLILLTAMVFYVVGTNVYFLISRHGQLWAKSIFRIGLYAIQNVYFIWRVWEIRKVDNYWHDIFMWVLISFFPIMAADTVLELILYFKLGKDTSTQSKVHNVDFPGSEESMIGMYFQLYFCSFFMTFFAEIGYIIVRILNCRNGGSRNYMSDEELKQEIEEKLSENSLPYNLNELVDKECSICQAELTRNESILKLKCQHMFHRECICQWLLRTNREYGQLKCPNCRADLVG